MSKYLSVDSRPTDISRRARVMLVVASALVLLVCVGVVEVGALTAVTIVSSGRNHQ